MVIHYFDNFRQNRFTDENNKEDLSTNYHFIKNGENEHEFYQDV
jgi:hypothetical protein